MRHEITQWGHEAWVGPDGFHFSDYGSLEEVARTAPHDCDVPGCPGPVNKRKLETFDELLAALQWVLNHYTEYLRSVGADPNQAANVVAARSAIAKAKQS